MEIMIERGIDPGPGTTSRPPISPVPLDLMAAEVEGDEKQL
jgi:hypothetical protein